jgi:hypothetical protein
VNEVALGHIVSFVILLQLSRVFKNQTYSATRLVIQAGISLYQAFTTTLKTQKSLSI